MKDMNRRSALALGLAATAATPLLISAIVASVLAKRAEGDPAPRYAWHHAQS